MEALVKETPDLQLDQMKPELFLSPSLCYQDKTEFTLSAKWTWGETLFNSTLVCLELALEKTVLVGEP